MDISLEKVLDIISLPPTKAEKASLKVYRANLLFKINELAEKQLDEYFTALEKARNDVEDSKEGS